MGHYDSDYEHEAEKRHKRQVKDAKKDIESLDAFRSGLQTNIPDRFMHALEDLHNWLKEQSR